MSDQRRWTWLYGPVGGGVLRGFLQPPATLDAADPPIPWLPLETPAGGSSPQSIVPTGIASGEALGTSKANFRLFPGALSSAEAFGTPLFILRLIASGIATQEALGTPAAHLRLFPATAASSEAFGTPTVLTPIIITSQGIGTGETLGTPFISLRFVLGGIPSAEGFGTAQLNLQLLPAAIGSGEAFGAALLAFTIAPTGIGGAEAFGQAALGFRLFADGVPSAEAFGATTVSQVGPQTIVAAGISSAEAFGDLAARQPAEPQQGYDIPFHHWRARLARKPEPRHPELALDQAIVLPGVVPGESFGGAKIIAHPRLIARAAPSGEAFGRLTLDQDLLGPDELVAIALILQEAA